MKLSVIILPVLLALTVDYVTTQTTGLMGGGITTTSGGLATTTGGPAGEVEYEAEEFPTTTTAKPTPKPKPRRRKGKGRRRGRPKGLKPKPGAAAKPGAKKPGPKKGRKGRRTTLKPTTPPPTPAPTTRPPTTTTTLAPTTKPPTPAPTQAPTQAPPIVAAANGYAAGGAPAVDVRVVPQRQRTSPAPTTRARAQYLYEPHSCPKMDVATWENEVVIYDNKNCAIIVRMNPRLRRPTVTFQAPYW